MVKAVRSLRTWAMAMAAGLVAAPAEAAPDVAAWLAANTDMTAAQVVIAGPDRVYSLEPLGSPTSAGEIVVLVRAETIAKDANGFASWDAHLLIDCLGGRLRAIRSAAYPRQNRKGAPKAEAASEDWTRPEAPEPAARLLAAACDPAFAWPLRVAEARPATTPAAAPPAPIPPPPAVTAQLPRPPSPAAQTFAVQVARGPSEEGAQRALKAARKTLGALSRELTDTTEVTSVGTERRYTVRLAGFRDEAAAKGACKTLAQAGQACFPWRGAAETPPAAAPTPAPAAKTTISGHAIQIARGPSEEGAQRALKAARKTLGASADGLTATTELSHVGARRRYTALLSGFPSAEAATRACATLTAAGQACFTTRQDDDAG